MTAPAQATSPWGLHWFRRDLRLAGNPALRWSWSRHPGRVLGLFCFDARFLARPDFSADRFAFFVATLESLRDELRAAGGDLLVLDEGPREAFARLIETLDARRIPRPATLSFNRDYEPFARERDHAVTARLADELGIAVHTEADHLLVEPEEILKDESPSSNEPRYYRVYSAFARRWFEALRTPRVRARLEAQRQGLAYLDALGGAAGARRSGATALFGLTWSALFGGAPPADHLQRFADDTRARARVPIPEAGSRAAHRQLRAFAARLPGYKTARDLPGSDGTSRLSLYFKNGSLTVAQAIAALGLEGSGFAEGSGESAFLRELCWREFYYHILWHRPDVETRAFLAQFRQLAWSNREDWFAAWKGGTTGYPIVDAGMRELDQTGFMHNRVRMIVASFLTKDLLIDWRWGERHFMERLLDGDLAANNGGWQWAASTGCDPQPYFRVFNPTLQSRRFDPRGIYLRRYLPERRDDDDDAIHLPRAPIVDHAAQKVAAIALYRARATERPA